MNTHSIDLVDYRAQSRGNSILYLGTAGSHGNEQLQVTQGKGWEGLTVQVVFHPCKVAVQLPANGVLDVPWEATARPLTALQGRIVFQGFDQDRLVNSTDLAYSVASHSPTLGRDEQPYTPGIVEGVLNQMAADKDAILQAAQQTGQAKEAAAASAAEAASSAANAQQSAGAANTSAGQAAASASQAAGSAAAANETLTQVQTAGQEAQQKVKDAETEALGNISAAAPALPAVSAAAAWQSATVKPDGTGYNLAAMAPIEATIRPTVTGNPAICKDSAAWGLQGLKIYGKSIQDGTPSLENPVPIISAGDGGSVDLAVNGANLMPYPYRTSAETINGVTFTVNPDGSITINGTASNNASFALQSNGDNAISWNLKKCFLSGNSISDNINEFRLGFCKYPGYELYMDKGTGVEVDLNEVRGWFFAEVRTGFSVQNKTIYPMLNTGLSVSPWQPYVSQSVSLSTPNGLPGIPVESGENFTDVDGQQLVCDVKDYGTGKAVQNVKIYQITGNETFFTNSSWDQSEPDIIHAHIQPDFFQDRKMGSNFLSDQFVCYNIPSGTPILNKECMYVSTTNKTVYTFISKSRLETPDLSGVKTWMMQHKPSIMYILDTPVETDIPAEELAAYRALTTYPGTTVVSTAEPVAGIEARYVMDGNKYRESVDKRLAALEAAQTGI